MKGRETHTSHSPEETEALGWEFSKKLLPGDIVGLVGELGSGKTCFVRGIAKGLGVKGNVKSPSFTILNIHEREEGRGEINRLYHLDLYRIKRTEEFYDAGFEEYIYGKGISVIEWADKFPELLEVCTVVIRFSYVGESVREIVIQRRGGSA
jgi:tRNA threonylcarbamoyladenosine biosynthesis protein TsaE